MTPYSFIARVVRLYQKARIARGKDERIRRGRSRAISSEVEDLFARYILANDPAIETIYVDQPLSYNGRECSFYPDIVVVKKGVICAFFDLKTDLGWQRDGLPDLCRRHMKTLTLVRGHKVKLWEAADEDKAPRFLKVAQRARYGVVIVSGTNVDQKNLARDRVKVSRHEPDVCVHVLTAGHHPNRRGVRIRDITRDEEAFSAVLSLIPPERK